jgi:2-keto-3-deoxy-L-rhamnonate aldolase RhmA
MLTIQNHAKQRLIAGELSLGMGLRQARTVDIARIARSCDYDWLFIDMEHNSMSVDMAAQISAAALDAGITPLVRVPAHEQFHATRLLDNGAMGIVVPHVNDRAEAERIVANCLFPPLGRRSVPGALPQVNFRPLPMADLIRTINDSMLIVAMIETPEGLANVDEIAAVQGIDVLLMGGSDLSAELGIPGEIGSATMRDAFARVVEACRRHGKYPGTGGVYDHALIPDYIEAGARFILSGSDLAFLMAGANARSSFLRSLPLRAGERTDSREAAS